MSAVLDAKQILFQDSLADVVRMLRNSRKSEQDTITEALTDIKTELTSSAQHVKVTAVVKLTYFAMLGYSGDHGAFHIIEVMADPQFQHKRAGYVAAAVILNESTPVLPLCTALLKRDLSSANQYEVSLALYCLSCVCTPDLARDLVSDVVGLINNSRAYIRKKAVLCLFKIFLQFPDALRPTYPRLKEKLEDNHEGTDTDPAVRGAVVNVLCELARRNPSNFLNLVPPFYGLLGTLHNNWTLIKIVKVFGYFTPLEPRLGKKLSEPLANLISTTHAKSVQYECLLAVANGMSKVSSLTKLAAEKMKSFVEDRDANLKYLGLDAMSRLMHDQPKLLSDQRDTVLACLADADQTIRRKALEILRGMATAKNLAATINAMFDNITVSPPDEDWSNLVIETIVATVAVDDYAAVQDFEWYLAVLLDLVQLPLTTFRHGALLAAELNSVVTRVAAVRPFGVESLAGLLGNAVLLTSSVRSTQWAPLQAAAFLCGEYPQWVPNKAQAARLLFADRILAMAPELQAECVQAATKLLVHLVAPCPRHQELQEGEDEADLPEDPTTVADIIDVVRGSDDGHRLAVLCRSTDADVQERAQLLQHVVSTATEEAAQGYSTFFAAPLEPIAEGAQAQVALPADVDLDLPFSDVLPSLIAVDEDSDDGASDSASDFSSDDSEDLRIRAQRSAKQQQARRTEVDPFYLKGAGAEGGSTEDLPPVEPAPDMPVQPSRFRARTGKAHTMAKPVAKPAGYVAPKSAAAREAEAPVDHIAAALQGIRVDEPVGRDEALPVIQPYRRQEAPSASPNRDDLPASPHATVSSLFSPIEVLAGGTVSLTLTVLECKVKKDGSFALGIAATAANTAEQGGNSLYDVAIAVPEAEGAMCIGVADSDGNAAEQAIIAPRVKVGATATAEFAALIGPLESLDEPLVLRVLYTERKKVRSKMVELPLLLKYFLDTPTRVESDVFHGVIMRSLEDAACTVASLPLPDVAKAPQTVDRVAKQLRLTVVDTLKDVVVLHGMVVHRKHKSSQGHLALLLQHEVVEGQDMLTVSVKTHAAHLINAVVSELSVAVLGDAAEVTF